MASRFLLQTGSAVIVALAATNAAVGQSPESPLAQAQQLLASGHSDYACALLELSGYGETSDAEALVLLGLCNEQIGNVSEAIGYYRLALDAVPDALLVRARLAALYAMDGQMSQAEASLETAMAATLVPLALEDEMVVSASDTPSVPAASPVSVRLGLSRLYDSNVNAGSSSNTMTGIIGGTPLPMTIDPGSQAISDSGTTLSLQARHFNQFGANHALLTSADLSATFYDDLSQYDRQSIGLAAALIYGDPLVTLTVQPSVRFGFEGGDFDTLRAALDATAERRLSPDLSIVAGAGLAYRHNPENTERSTWDGLLSTGLVYSLTDNLEVGVAYAVRPTMSGRATESYLGHGPEISLTARLTDDISFGLSYGYAFTVYDETLALFPDDREEHRHRLAAELSMDLSDHIAEGLGLSARYEFSTTDSTLPLYDNERHAASVGLFYNF